MENGHYFTDSMSVVIVDDRLATIEIREGLKCLQKLKGKRFKVASAFVSRDPDLLATHCERNPLWLDCLSSHVSAQEVERILAVLRKIPAKPFQWRQSIPDAEASFLSNTVQNK